MGECDFECLGEWRRKQHGSAASFLNDERQKVSGRASPLPTEGQRLAGEGQVFRVAEDRAVQPLVTGVAEKLMIPDSHHRALACRRGENCQEGLDFPAVCGDLEMLQKGLMNLGRLGNVAQVANFQRRPEKTANAAGIIPPSHAGAVLEFLE